MGRHVHIAANHMHNVHDPQVLYIKARLVPNPDQAKDWITHELYWHRMGEFTHSFFLPVAFLVLIRSA